LAAVVENGDRDRPAVARGLGFGGVGDTLGGFECQQVFGRQLRLFAGARTTVAES